MQKRERFKLEEDLLEAKKVKSNIKKKLEDTEARRKAIEDELKALEGRQSLKVAMNQAEKQALDAQQKIFQETLKEIEDQVAYIEKEISTRDRAISGLSAKIQEAAVREAEQKAALENNRRQMDATRQKKSSTEAAYEEILQQKAEILKKT